MLNEVAVAGGEAIEAIGVGKPMLKEPGGLGAVEPGGAGGVGEEGVEFAADAFGGDGGEPIGEAIDDGFGSFVEVEAELGGLAVGAEDAEGVVGEVFGGDHAQAFIFEVAIAVERIDEGAVVGVEGDGVDGEVAAV